jgi:hypothetical protein
MERSCAGFFLQGWGEFRGQVAYLDPEWSVASQIHEATDYRLLTTEYCLPTTEERREGWRQETTGPHFKPQTSNLRLLRHVIASEARQSSPEPVA